MQKELEQMLFKLKMQNISAKKIEKELGFSNGVLGKAVKGKSNLSKARFELVRRYFNLHFIDDKSNPLINIARGRDKDGVNDDETISHKKVTPLIEDDVDEEIKDDKDYDYYYKKVVEYKDPITTPYEREDLAKEIKLSEILDKKQKDFLINSLKN